jgi:hypothetical protein
MIANKDDDAGEREGARQPTNDFHAGGEQVDKRKRLVVVFVL